MSDVPDPLWWKKVEIKMKKDAMLFFTVEELKKNQFKGTCKFCDTKLSSTGVGRYLKKNEIKKVLKKMMGKKFIKKPCFRFAIHLGFPGTGCSKCSNLPKIVQAAFKELGKAWQEETKKASDKRQLDEDTADPSIQGSIKKRQICLKDALNISAVQNADAAIARFFFAQAIPFATIESPYFLEMIRALQSAPSSYMPPNRRKLSGRLLDDAFKKVQKKFDHWKKIFPLRSQKKPGRKF
jgi:hypothetical protein